MTFSLPRFRTRIRRLFRLADSVENPVLFTKYLNGRLPGEKIELFYQPIQSGESLPVPPPDLWLGYGSTPVEYVESGKTDVTRMAQLLLQAGFDFEKPGGAVLDLGCGGGRMVRHLEATADQVEVWGLDISVRHINWLKTHLAPPFHFAVNTTLPHLPFGDGYFSCVYCGSVFTHIDDFAETWFLEIRRILAPGGLLFCTLHDDSTRNQLQREPFHPVVRAIRDHDLMQPGHEVPDIVVIGDGPDSNVFYRDSYLRALFEPRFEIVKIEPSAYGYQSAWVLRSRAA
jgi:SAM-dependent methyltransferase